MANLSDLVYVQARQQQWFISPQASDPLATTPDSFQLWMASLAASLLVGMAGIVPLAFVSFAFECVQTSSKSEANKRLRLMLSFAVGALLGDTFLHLLPEAWSQFSKTSANIVDTHQQLGFLVLLGITTFIFLQMIFAISEQIENNDQKQIIGYLNLFANGIDNFTHGLAIAASFISGNKIGLLTTVAIILHEIPHEFADFAILIRSGFSKWNAIRAQILTTSIGLLGTLFALQTQHLKFNSSSVHHSHSLHSYVLPYTAGCFLHIALSSILPEIVREDNWRESLKQLLWIVMGVLVMALVNILIE